MAKRTRAAGGKRRPVESYDHKGKKRANNPPVGLVMQETDPDARQKKTYEYDPHLDPRFVIEHADAPEYSLVTRSSDGQVFFLANMPSGCPAASRTWSH